MLADRIGDGSEEYLLGGMMILALVIYNMLGRHGGDPTDEFGWDEDIT